MRDSLGDRMKNNYENCYKIKIPKRMPLILRLDGKAFHTFSRRFIKPYDAQLMRLMDLTAISLCEQIQGTQFSYVQSDEISIFVHNYKSLESGAWFDNSLQKLVSVSAGIASAAFTLYHAFDTKEKQTPVVFDSRAFVLPESEVVNYFIWRQKDWERNSVAMLAQSLFSHKALLGKSKEQQKDMCFLRGYKWEELGEDIKNGRMVVKGDAGVWNSIPAPIFMQNRGVIDGFIKTEDTLDANKSL